jgi:calcium-dependent protein kinase
MGINASKSRSQIRTGRRLSKYLSVPANIFIQQSSGYIAEKYDIIENIGSGAFSEVKLCTHKQTNEKRAVKIIHKGSLYLDQLDENNQLQELKILTSLVHPNILRCYEVFEDHFKFYIVTEFCEGGTLFEMIKDFSSLTEGQVSKLIFQVLSAISYCHEEKHVIHRDLKPENILIEGNSINIKLADFGSACYLDPGQKLQKALGTPYYIAPEVLSGDYNEKCDVWSCGIILFMLLTGKPPYQGRNQKEILKNIKESPFLFRENEFPGISLLAVDLIKRMVCVNPEERISASEALNHFWFQGKEQGGKRDLTETLKQLARFSSTSKLKDAVYTYLATQIISKDEMQRLTSEFQLLDKNGDGKISKLELMDQYTSIMGEKNAVKVVDSIMAQVDSNQSGDIDYIEFVKACMDYKQTLSKENLKFVFRLFDQDDSGEITLDEIKSLLGKHLHLSDKTWVEMIQEVDKNGDGKIDLREFILCLTA